MNMFPNLSLWGSDSTSSDLSKSWDSFTSSATGLWDRVSNGVGDLGRGLQAEGLNGLMDLGGMMDRQQTARELGAPLPKTGAVPGPALEAPVERASLIAPLARSGPVQGKAEKVPALRMPDAVERDSTPDQGWRKNQGGGWTAAGAAAPRPTTRFGLTDSKYMFENDKYFQGGADRTRYFDDDERAAHRLRSGDGLVRHADGKVMDTQGADAALTPGSGRGANLFAAQGSRVYATDAIADNEASRVAANATGSKREATHHSTFLGGAAVDAAGEMTTHAGWLKMISNNSGHHKPGVDGNIQAVEALDAMGVNTDAAIVHHIGFDKANDVESHDYFNARAFAASRGDEELLQTHKDMFGQIHGAAGALRSGNLHGGISRDDVQAARGAGAPAPASTRDRIAASPVPTAAARRAEDDRYQQFAEDAMGSLPGHGDVDRQRVSSVNQAQTHVLRHDREMAASIDVRGARLSGWSAGAYDERDRLTKAAVEKYEAEQLQRELASKQAAAAPAPAVVAPPAPTMNYLPPKMDYLAPTTDYLAPKTDYLAPKMNYGPPDLDFEPAEKVETKAERKAKKAAARAEAKDQQRKQAAADRVEGAHLGLHEAPVHASHAGTAVDGWRRQQGAVVNAPLGLRGVNAWRRDEDAADTRSARPTTSFPVDPRKTSHYANEFTSYIPGARENFGPGLEHQVTKRYNDAELRDHELHAAQGDEIDARGKRHVQSGLLHRANGDAVDTTHARETKMKGSDAGRNIFALDGFDVHSASHKDRRQALYAADVAFERGASLAAARQALAGGAASATVAHTHHSSFNGGKDLDGAGDVAVKQGFVQRISNQSGHYEPGVVSNYQTIKAMDRMGVNLDATTVENKVKVDDDMTTETFQARAMLASGNDLPRMRAQKSVFADVQKLGGGEQLENLIRPSAIPADMRGRVSTRRSKERPAFLTEKPAPSAPAEVNANFAD